MQSLEPANRWEQENPDLKTIYFYSTKEEPYGCFSNFSAHSFDLDGLHWPTSEHYFQAAKFPGTAHAEKIRTTPSPMIIARMGRSRSQPIRTDWNEVKDGIMRKALLAKFRSNPDIREVLLSTGDATLVEATSEDYYWGCGTNGTGLNMLGKILMEVREQLRKEQAKP